MARILLGTTPQTQTSLDSRVRAAPTSSLSASAIEERLRRPRSAAYLEAMTGARVDSGGHTADPHAAERLLAALRDEFPDISLEQYPLGIVAKCYLGTPFEVHTFDFGVHIHPANVVHHYKTLEALPGVMEQARSLALNPAYAFVEVYSDKIVPVAWARTVSFVSLKGGGAGVAPY